MLHTTFRQKIKSRNINVTGNKLKMYINYEVKNNNLCSDKI